uniref:Uncharacterized protein n=1 Tax=Archaeoglobus fulgidus TaxID=2234 RepID=A0A7C3RLX0_ARCFL
MIDEDRVRELAGILRRMKYTPITFDNPELFPEPDSFIYPNYVFFMVAIDHRTGFDVDFRYHGSDLLFYLARKKQLEEREFFTARNLVKIDAECIRKTFIFRGKTVAKPEERAFLLKDCAEKLLKYYEGDFMNLLSRADFMVENILPRLKIFKAYEDPLMKKSFLLLKILKRQGFVRGKLKFPVDSVLVEIAVSSGILILPEEIMEKINAGTMLSIKETNFLRELTQKSLMLVSERAGIEADIIDDLLWAFGRERIPENSPLSEKVDKKAVKEFIEFINFRPIKKIAFPPSWYF